LSFSITATIGKEEQQKMPVNLKAATSAQEGKKKKKDFFKAFFNPVDADVDNEVDLFFVGYFNKTFKSEEISDFKTAFSEIQRNTSILRICGTFVQHCWKDLCTAEKWVVRSKF
jgi:hypothetical protein